MLRNKNSRSNILFIIPSLQGGGAERVIVNLLRHFDRDKYVLSLAVVDTRFSVYKKDLPYDIEFIDLNCTRVRSALIKILRLIWYKKPEIVFSTLGHLNLAISMLKPLLPHKTNYIVREATVVSHLPNAYNIPFWWFWAYRRFYTKLDFVICQSNFMRDDLVRNLNISVHKTTVINNPVDLKYIRALLDEKLDADSYSELFPRDKINLVAAGSLTAVKRFDVLIDAISLCENKNITLTIMGDGPLRDSLNKQILEKKLDKHVRIIGFQENPYIYYSKADALAICSRFEGFPNVVLEAMACGTPVVATPIPGGLSEILDNVDGCIISDSETPESLSKVLNNISKDKRVRVEVVEKYNIKNIIKNYEAIFDSLIGH